MDEKEEAISVINAYIQRLEYIKKNIDDEIESKYFNLSCLGNDLEVSSMILFKKYHRKDE
jgi:uncharacterized protein (UPF0335 family)